MRNIRHLYRASETSKKRGGHWDGYEKKRLNGDVAARPAVARDRDAAAVHQGCGGACSSCSNCSSAASSACSRYAIWLRIAMPLEEETLLSLWSSYCQSEGEKNQNEPMC